MQRDVSLNDFLLRGLFSYASRSTFCQCVFLYILERSECVVLLSYSRGLDQCCFAGLCRDSTALSTWQIVVSSDVVGSGTLDQHMLRVWYQSTLEQSVAAAHSSGIYGTVLHKERALSLEFCYVY